MTSLWRRSRQTDLRSGAFLTGRQFIGIPRSSRWVWCQNTLSHDLEYTCDEMQCSNYKLMLTSLQNRSQKDNAKRNPQSCDQGFRVTPAPFNTGPHHSGPPHSTPAPTPAVPPPYHTGPLRYRPPTEAILCEYSDCMYTQLLKLRYWISSPVKMIHVQYPKVNSITKKYFMEMNDRLQNLSILLHFRKIKYIDSKESWWTILYLIVWCRWHSYAWPK